MGVRHISYNIAQCDICGKTEEFSTSISMPKYWNSIKDTQLLICYGCVCPECIKSIKEYINELKSLHHNS